MSILVKDQAVLHRFAVWLMVKRLTKHLGIQKYTIGGSYRRGKRWCNDIDLLIPISSEEEKIGLINLIEKEGWKIRSRITNSEDVFSKQFTKKINNKIVVLDVFLVPPGCWGNAMLFTTGPREFNDKIREGIVSMGYTWGNPRYFTHIRSNKQISFDSEKSAMRFLGLSWIHPKKRK